VRHIKPSDRFAQSIIQRNQLKQEVASDIASAPNQQTANCDSEFTSTKQEHLPSADADRSFVDLNVSDVSLASSGDEADMIDEVNLMNVNNNVETIDVSNRANSSVDVALSLVKLEKAELYGGHDVAMSQVVPEDFNGQFIDLKPSYSYTSGAGTICSFILLLFLV